MEFGNPQTLNGKIKFSSLSVEGNELVMQLGFEIQGGKTVISDKKVVNSSFIALILSVLEVRSWEELPRKFARVRVSSDKVVSVGNLIDNRWLDL